MIKRCLTSLVATLIVCFLACSSASARVCFLPDSTDCGEGDVVGSGNVDVPCQYSSCPAYNSNYQECYDERTYNNAGVNVTCKQIRCKLSKSKCEELEADANNSQCCNFDSASGCYYMGKCPILCNRNIYDRTIDLSGEDYTCTSCKDKNGTFYNCTPIEKECSQIDASFSTSCGDSQIAKEAYKNGVLAKDSHGNQCYTCEDKPVDENCKIKGGCIIDMASIGHNSGHGTIGTGDNTEITYTCYITKAENATEADLQKIYGIMYSDFNCQSSMGQIMSSGYQRVGGVINLSSSPVSGKFTVGELTRLANCQGNTAEYNWDTKIELYNGTDHCNFTEEIFTKTCKQLGYINKNNNCSSNNLVKTLVENVIGTDGQCYTCKEAQTCSTISNGTWKGEKDKNTCPTGYKPEVVKSTIGATVFSDGPCYKCEKIEDKTITIYLTNTETKDQSSSTLICNRQIERVNSTTKEYVEFSHDSNHTVKLRLNGPNKPCTELYAHSIVLEEDNSYDLYAEFPSGDGSISGYYYDNVPTSFEVIVDGVVVASDEIRRGKIDNTNWTHLRVLSSLNGKVIQPSESNPYTIKFVY